MSAVEAGPGKAEQMLMHGNLVMSTCSKSVLARHREVRGDEAVPSQHVVLTCLNMPDGQRHVIRVMVDAGCPKAARACVAVKGADGSAHAKRQPVGRQATPHHHSTGPLVVGLLLLLAALSLCWPALLVARLLWVWLALCAGPCCCR